MPLKGGGKSALESSPARRARAIFRAVSLLSLRRGNRPAATDCGSARTAGAGRRSRSRWRRAGRPHRGPVHAPRRPPEGALQEIDGTVRPVVRPLQFGAGSGAAQGVRVRARVGDDGVVDQRPVEGLAGGRQAAAGNNKPQFWVERLTVSPFVYLCFVLNVAFKKSGGNAQALFATLTDHNVKRTDSNKNNLF